MHQPDVSRFAPGEKINRVLPRQNQILHVKNDRQAAFFRPEECFQLGYAFFVHSTAKGNEHFPIRRPVNSEQDQSPSPNSFAKENASQPPIASH